MWPKSPLSVFATALVGAAVIGAFIPAPLAAAAPKSSPAKPAAGGTKAAPPKAADKPSTPPVSQVKKPDIKDYDLTPAQQERLQKYLPRAYPKLAHRDPFHVVVIGDEVVGMAAHNDDAGNMLKAWPVKFVNELSNQFFYTGGVRLIKPLAGKPNKEQEKQLGPEITLRCLPREEGLITQAMQTLTTYGFESTPDLVIVSFGIHDAGSAQDLGSYARALQQIVETVRAKGSDLILVSPTLTAGSTPTTSLGATRAFVSTMKEIAESSSVLFGDAGDLNGLVKLDAKTLDPARLIEETLKSYRRFFWSSPQDNLHPVAELHRLISLGMFDLTLNGAKPSPWKLNGGAATFDNAGHFNLSAEIENPGKEPLTVFVGPLETARWKSAAPAQKIELKAGAKQSLAFAYDLTKSDDNGAVPPFPSHEPLLRMPLLISTGAITRVEEVHADIKPVALLLRLESQFNQKDGFTLENVVVNGSGSALKGLKWSAEWAGQKKSGSLDIAANATGEMALKFDLPRMSSKDSLPLKIDITANSVPLHWERLIECTPNLGLKQDMHLVALGKNKGRVRLRADADPSSLFLTFDLDGVELEAGPNGTALQLQLSLDARSYGKRQTFGAVEPLTLSCGAADGAGVTAKIAPWAFGTGYAMDFDPAYVRSQLSSGRSGGRRLTVTIPRSYLYLHEWALGNGNSELGINTRLSFWHAGGFDTDGTFSITNNGRPVTDAQGLSCLELTDEPTSRWTVVIW